jgi:hypothetical protein
MLIILGEENFSRNIILNDIIEVVIQYKNTEISKSENKITRNGGN